MFYGVQVDRAVFKPVFADVMHKRMVVEFEK